MSTCETRGAPQQALNVSSSPSSSARSAWLVILASAAILMVTMGIRQSIGLFISPLNTSTGLGITTISLAVAVAQFMWGAAQPVAGALADRFGAAKVLVGGIVALAVGTAMTPFMTSGFGLMVALGLFSAVGSGAGSFSVLVGATTRRLAAEERGKAAGIINAGGSFGQFVFAPLSQLLIQAIGWMGALWSLAVIALGALPLARVVSPAQPGPPQSPGTSEPWQAARAAMTNRSYLLLHAGFFTCGFHIAFLVTHLPTEVGLCGLPPAVASWSLALIGLANIAGSLVSGSATSRLRSKYILAIVYASRAFIIIGCLLAPRTAVTFYVFAATLGLTWLATVPPTAAIVGKLFGMRYLSTLFGLTLLSHQIGGFLGAYLGGVALTHAGNYQWMWYADIALAVAAALINLPIREARVEQGLRANA